MNHFKTIALASISAMFLFSCQKEVDSKLSGKSGKPSKIDSEKAVSVVWGLGADNRVYRWNGATWSEPTPTMRLVRISVGQDNNAAVWGINSDGRIYKWSGSAWSEPNTAARLSNISAYSANVAFGVSQDAKVLFKTTDGGLNWTSISLTGIPYPTILTTSSISTMDGVKAVIVRSDGTPYTYNGTSWQTLGVTPGFPVDFAMASGYNNVCWAVQKPSGSASYGPVYRYNGSYWSTPNPAAGLATVSMSDEEVVWGTGGDNRVYRWNAATNVWDEPNPAAGLKAVSSGN